MVSTRKLFLGPASILASLLFLPAAFAAPYPAHLSFSVPHSSATYPLSINKDLTVTGYYKDSSGNDHGFLRCFDGTITVFDVPGSLQTKPVSINDDGEITGYYSFVLRDFGPSQFGFIRHKDGYITTVGITTDNGWQQFMPQPVAINRHGEVVGVALDSAGDVFEPFFRSASGMIRAVNISQVAAYSAFPTAVNEPGDVVGYGGAQFLDHVSGLLWKNTGRGQAIEPGAVFSYPGSTGTAATAINDKGEIAGCYNVNDVYHYFLRTPGGTFTKLDPPGTVPSCLATFNTTTSSYDPPSALSLNNRGTVVGLVIDNAKVPVGFVRFPDGRTMPFAIPGSTRTVLTSTNDEDVIAGYYTKGDKTEGFIACP